MKDSLGVQLTGATSASLPHYDKALQLLQCYLNDPVAANDLALAASPDFVMAHVLKAWLHLLGTEPGPWHGVNVALHAIASLLLASLFLAARIPPAAALLGAALFALHPALVEGVAWISQLKTVLCGVFAFAALRALRARPALATALFAAALLSKPHALLLLPTAAALNA